mmetsp:Transcript_29926/g.78875  ORF Transcript_29926/g.78875 Transcript_29926/m.78875 type:complete len:161 (+) Transcript_29926:72-554(+)
MPAVFTKVRGAIRISSLSIVDAKKDAGRRELGGLRSDSNRRNEKIVKEVDSETDKRKPTVMNDTNDDHKLWSAFSELDKVIREEMTNYPTEDFDLRNSDVDDALVYVTGGSNVPKIQSTVPQNRYQSRLPAKSQTTSHLQQGCRRRLSIVSPSLHLDAPS